MKTNSWLRLEFALLLAILVIGYVQTARPVWGWLASWF
jgi:hypothetical protein